MSIETQYKQTLRGRKYGFWNWYWYAYCCKFGVLKRLTVALPKAR